MDLETTPFYTKASKTYLDPITLIVGDLNNIGDTVQDATVELL